MRGLYQALPGVLNAVQVVSRQFPPHLCRKSEWKLECDGLMGAHKENNDVYTICRVVHNIPWRGWSDSPLNL
jgi:hypothetical protein